MQQLIHIPCDPDYPSIPETYINPGAVFGATKCHNPVGREFWKVYSVALNLVANLSPRQMEILAEKTGAVKNTITSAPVKPPTQSAGADPTAPTDISSFNVLD